MASIDQVQAMLRDEAVAAAQAEMPTQITRPPSVEPEPSQLIGGVPSAAEVEESRAARWADEGRSVAVVRRRRLGGVRWGLGAVLVAIAGAAGWFGARLSGSSPVQPPVALAVAQLDSAVSQAALEAEARRLAVEVRRLEAALAAERQRPRAPKPAPASVAPASAPPSSVKRAQPRPARAQARARRPRMLVTRPGAPRVRSKAKPRRTRSRRLNAQDKRLDSLIDGL